MEGRGVQQVQPWPRTGSQPSASIGHMNRMERPIEQGRASEGGGAMATQSGEPEVKESNKRVAAAARRHPPAAPTNSC